MKKLFATLALVALPIVGFLCATLIPPMAAHAQATAPLPPPQTLGLMEYAGLALAAIAGIKATVDVLLSGLKWLAPRTQTTVDDALRDEFQRVHDRLDSFEGLVGKLVPPQTPALASVPRNNQAGFTRTQVMLVLAAVGVTLVATLTGCAASQRTDTIKAAMVGVDAARDGFLAYDRAHELELVNQSVSADDAHAKLAAYQTKRAKIDPLFVGAYHAVAAAELLNSDQSLTSMQATLAQLYAAVQAFIGGK